MNEKYKDVLGPGLGPDWAVNLPIKGLHEVPEVYCKNIGIAIVTVAYSTPTVSVQN